MPRHATGLGASGFPAANKLLMRYEADRAYKLHQQRLQNTRHKLDVKEPKRYNHLILRLKQIQKEEERQAEIDHENKVLLNKMTHVMKYGGNIDNWNNYESRSLNFPLRERQNEEIARQNIAIARRLETVRPGLQINSWEKDYQQHMYLRSLWKDSTKDFGEFSPRRFRSRMSHAVKRSMDNLDDTYDEDFHSVTTESEEKHLPKLGRHKKDPRKAKSETNAPISPRKEEHRAGGGRQTKLPKITPHRAFYAFSASCICKVNGRIYLFSTLNEIRQFRTAKKDYSGVVTTGHKIGAMDVDIARRLIYWTDETQGGILRANLPKRIGRVALPQNIGVRSPKPYAIAIDWVESNIYWTDLQRGSISVAMFDGRYQLTIIEGLTEPLAIAVNPELGLLYWADADPLTPKIERSWMNGADRKVLVSTRLVRPSALTIDYVMNNTLYWADYKLGVVESINMDGTNRQQIMNRAYRPVSLDVFETRLYWVSRFNGSAYSIDKFGMDNVTVIQTGLLSPSGIRVFNRLRVDLNVKPRCPQSGQKCSHLCLRTPDSFKCACPEKTKFQGDSEYICDAAFEIPKTEPRDCGCMHGAECLKVDNGTYICKCLSGFSGPYCEHIEPKKLSYEISSKHMVAILASSSVIFILILVLIFVVLFVFRHKWSCLGQSKGSGKVVFPGNEGAEIPSQSPQPFTVEANKDNTDSTNFSNPVYETFQGQDPEVSIHGIQETSVTELPIESIPEISYSHSSRSADDAKMEATSAV